MSLPLLEYDLPDLLTAFSELLPLTNEELGQYWFRYNRSDGLALTLSMSVYDNTVGVILKSGEAALASLHLSWCLFVRVIGTMENRYVQVGGSRNNPDALCTVSLDGAWIMKFEDSPPS